MSLDVTPGRHWYVQVAPRPRTMSVTGLPPTAPVRPTALVADTDPGVREELRLHLALSGYDVTECRDGRTAAEHLHAVRVDIIVVDAALPGIDGLTLCRGTRASGPNADTPLVLLSTSRAEADAVLGLHAGADDYVTKPFSVQELMARVGALRRRLARQDRLPAPAAPLVRAMGIVIDVGRRHATVGGAPVDLTRQEFDVLHLLAARRGMVFSRAALLTHVWPRDVTVTGRTVDTVVSRLRRKIDGLSGDGSPIVTVRGVGYKFADGD